LTLILSAFDTARGHSGDIAVRRLSILIGLFFSPSLFAKNGEQLLNVSGVECRHIAKNVTARMVEKDPKRYVDSCVQWNGVVVQAVEADVANFIPEGFNGLKNPFQPAPSVRLGGFC